MDVIFKFFEAEEKFDKVMVNYLKEYAELLELIGKLDK